MVVGMPPLFCVHAQKRVHARACVSFVFVRRCDVLVLACGRFRRDWARSRAGDQRACVVACVRASATGVWSCLLCCSQVRAVNRLMNEGSWTWDTAEGWGPDDTRLCMPPTSKHTIPRHNLHGCTRVSPHAHCVCRSFWDFGLFLMLPCDRSSSCVHTCAARRDNAAVRRVALDTIIWHHSCRPVRQK